MQMMERFMFEEFRGQQEELDSEEQKPTRRFRGDNN